MPSALCWRICDLPRYLYLCVATACAVGTDTTDCANDPNPPACRYLEDGECDEGEYCPPGTDTADCCDAGLPTLDPTRWPLRRDAEGHPVGDPPERLQPQNVDCSPDIGAAASRDGHIGGGHISRETGKAYGKEGGTGSLVFALVIIAVGMGLAAYSRNKLIESRTTTQGASSKTNP